jgi:GntR family transcriptional regulator/MocR family aminotransferase
MRLLNLPEPRSINGRKTRYLAVAAALRAAIRTGQLASGEYLPSSRELAAEFEVHRHTVQVALDALVAEGWVMAEPRRGFRVCASVPEVRAPRRSAARSGFRGFRVVRTGVELRSPASGTVAFPLHSATPDPLLVPRAELRRAYAHVLDRYRGELLDIGDERGLPALRTALGQYLRRARAVVPEDLVLTHGSQEAIALVGQSLLGPGDAVAVEEPGYPPAWAAFRAAGATVVPVPVDAHGLSIDHLKEVLERHPVRLVYVTPTHQYPTTVSLSGIRRDELLRVTLARGVPILEDDYDHEYHYRGSPPAPLSATGAPHVLYVSTFSKLVAPTFRIGWVAGSRDIVEQLVQLRRVTTRANDAVTEAALADWMQDGGFERHLRRARRCYAERCERAVESLEHAAREVPMVFEAPSGGLSIWVRFPGLDVMELARRASDRGVVVAPEPLLGSKRDGNGVRLAFGRIAPERFRQAVGILASVAEEMRRAPVASGRVRVLGRGDTMTGPAKPPDSRSDARKKRRSP